MKSKKGSVPRNAQTNMMTVETTLSREKISTYRSNAPGPGSYNFKSAFPSGPKFVIQRKTKFDSLFKTKIS